MLCRSLTRVQGDDRRRREKREKRGGNSGGWGAGWPLEFPNTPPFPNTRGAAPEYLDNYSGRDFQRSAAPSSSPTDVSLGLCQGILVLRLVKLCPRPATAPCRSESSLIAQNAKAVIPFLLGSHLIAAVVRPKEMEFADQDCEFISSTLA